MQHIKVHTQQYISFDQTTGEIFSIGPSVEEGYQYIKVTAEEVEPIKSLKEKMTDYIVAYNRKTREFRLKKQLVNNDEIFYQKLLKISSKTDYDIVLTIDKKDKKCYIITNEELLDVMKKTNIDINKKISFSFTKKDDPHVLYETVDFDISKSQKKKFNSFKNYDVYSNSSMARCVYKEIK
ncbi:MAG: hypothetical protein CMA64_06120 [Euryarchaeota archaeon]|nr:hypothetical protein [Euryarchaeota archaeon]|tara:strand:+ start:149 stop:691 length:543 start_codon:yes stop_codon:yes gene_type:complete